MPTVGERPRTSRGGYVDERLGRIATTGLWCVLEDTRFTDMSDECRHGMNPEWCSSCRGHDDSAYGGVRGSGFLGGEAKQDQLDRLCEQLGIPKVQVGVGSSLPSHVFESAARQCRVPLGSMPEIGEALARRAGLLWSADCDSRGTISGGGSTVTREGLDVINRAVAGLLPPR